MKPWHGPERRTFRIRPGQLTKQRKWIAEFLRFHGYGARGTAVEVALRRFQERNGAPATGRLNHATCRLLNARRCAHPERTTSRREDEARFLASPFQPARLTWIPGGVDAEIDVKLPPVGHPFELVQCRWSRRTIRYALVGACPKALGERAWDPIRTAFSTWSDTGEIAFRETPPHEPAEIRVLWTPGPGDSTGDDPFYGPGGVVAVGYYPFPHYDDDLAGDLHLESSEPWSLTGQGGGVDVETVALHEIGHCLGIGHCANTRSAMYSAYQRRRRALTQLDLDEVRRKYVDAPW
jgi:hypothetical protein